jgi:2-oxo-4-hydroxy-4-carboxy-5-ureidoimidazoline decarboxylase
MTTWAGVSGFNALQARDALTVLLGCCASTRWAGQVAAGRPYASVEAALRRSDEAVAGLTTSDLAEALSAHPRIGERTGERDWPHREQAGVAGAHEATLRELAASNAAYEQRFGHVYLVCATGRSAAELLGMLRARLGNDPAAEWHVVRSELGKINRIRLRTLLGEPA